MRATHRIDKTLAALADPVRRRIVDLLRREPQRASELAAAIEMSAPALSRHLRVLRERGLVEDRPDRTDARARTLRLKRKPFSDLAKWLDEVESFWTDQLAAFKKHAGS